MYVCVCPSINYNHQSVHQILAIGFEIVIDFTATSIVEIVNIYR